MFTEIIVQTGKNLRGINGGHSVACAVHWQWIKPLNSKHWQLSL